MTGLNHLNGIAAVRTPEFIEMTQARSSLESGSARVGGIRRRDTPNTMNLVMLIKD